MAEQSTECASHCCLGRDGEGSSEQKTECVISHTLGRDGKDRHNKIQNVQTAAL